MAFLGHILLQAEHPVHVVQLDAPAVEYVPAEHVLQVLPAVEYVPVEHSLQLVAPSPE